MHVWRQGETFPLGETRDAWMKSTSSTSTEGSFMQPSSAKPTFERPTRVIPWRLTKSFAKDFFQNFPPVHTWTAHHCPQWFAEELLFF